MVSWVCMDREILWREVNSYFNVQKENCLKKILKRFWKLFLKECCWKGFFRYGQWRPTVAPSPFLLKGARAKALSFAFLSLHLFLTIFARVQSRLLFSKKFLTCSSLSLPFSVHRTCCISAPFSLPNWSKAVGRYRSLTCKGLTNLTLPLLRRGRSPLCLGRQIDWWSWFVSVLIGKQWHFDIPSK